MPRLSGRLLTLALACLVTNGCRSTAEDDATSWIGTWSAPSLSRPDIPIIITLASDARATEDIGTYRGTGRWRAEGTRALIEWTSGWRGELVRTSRGFELRTWRAGSDFGGPPDDAQPARGAAS